MRHAAARRASAVLAAAAALEALWERLMGTVGGPPLDRSL